MALAIAAVLLVMLLFGGGSSYKITAQFQNAGQLVNGNLVEVGGVKAGLVSDISLGDNGTALVELEIDEEFAPLHEGTLAVIRQGSLSSIAGRHVALLMPEGDEQGDEISDGDLLPLSATVSTVDLDQLFNTFDKETIENFKKVIKGFARSYDGIGPQTNRGFHYLNPFLSTGRELFAELTFDERRFERLIIDTATLSGALAERAPDIEQFVSNGNRMMGALAAENVALASAIEKLPDFMRSFNTTAVNLRAALDDIDPLVEASKPVARKLPLLTEQLRGFAIDAVPTIRDLDQIVSQPGPGNDLIELTLASVPLARIAIGPVRRNGADRRGAFPESVDALTDSLPALAQLRPYITAEGLSGWFDDFGPHSGLVDAQGGIVRISTTFNAFTISPITGGPDLLDALSPAEVADALVQDQMARCPGANERDPGDGSTPFTDGGRLNCDASQVPIGP